MTPALGMQAGRAAVLWRAVCLALVAVLAGCAPRATVNVTWTTGSELNTAGFNLYRAMTETGPFEKVNTALIAASSGSVAGHSYSFEDSGVVPGQTYFYQLEDVEVAGASTRHGPIRVTAAPTPEPAVLGAVVAGAIVAGLAVLWRARAARR